MHTIIPRKTTKLSFGLLFNSLWFSYDPNAWTLSLSLGTQNLHFSCVFPQSKWALSDFVKLPAVRHSLSCLIGHYGSGRAPRSKKERYGCECVCEWSESANKVFDTPFGVLVFGMYLLLLMTMCYVQSKRVPFSTFGIILFSEFKKHPWLRFQIMSS